MSQLFAGGSTGPGPVANACKHKDDWLVETSRRHASFFFLMSSTDAWVLFSLFSHEFLQ